MINAGRCYEREACVPVDRHIFPTVQLSQLFDEDNPLHKSENKYIFTTEGHVVPIDERFREKQWKESMLMDQDATNVPPSNTSNVRSEPGRERDWNVSGEGQHGDLKQYSALNVFAILFCLSDCMLYVVWSDYIILFSHSEVDFAERLIC